MMLKLQSSKRDANILLVLHISNKYADMHINKMLHLQLLLTTVLKDENLRRNSEDICGKQNKSNVSSCADIRRANEDPLVFTEPRLTLAVREELCELTYDI